MPQPIFRMPDRRAPDRPQDPRCQTCHGGEVKAIVRTVMAVYYRCYVCNQVWGEPKPQASIVMRDALKYRAADWPFTTL